MNPDRAPASSLPALAVVGAAVLFGTTGTAQELGPDGTTPLGVGTLRIVVGAAALWCFARRWPSTGDLVRHWRPFVLGGLGVAVYQPGFFTGTARSGVALGTIVALGSGPLFAGIVEWRWLGTIPGRRWALATVVAVAGGSLLVAAGTAGASAGATVRVDAVGIAASLSAGFGYAVYAVASKVLIRSGVHSTVSLAWPFTIGAVALLPFAAFAPLDWVGTVEGAVMLAHLGVLTVGVAYVLYGWGLRWLDTSTAVTLTLAEPVTAALVAVIVLDERLRPAGWLGAALVLTGLLLAGRPVRPIRPVGPSARRPVGPCAVTDASACGSSPSPTSSPTSSPAPGVTPGRGRGWGRRGGPRGASSGTAAATARRVRRRRGRR